MATGGFSWGFSPGFEVAQGDFSFEFSSEFDVAPRPTISGTSTVSLRSITSVAAGSRAIPVRSASGGITLPRLSYSATGTRSFPGNTALSSVTFPKLSSLSAGIRTIPSRTASGAVLLPGVVTSAAGSVAGAISRTGVIAVRLPLARSTATGARTLPTRTLSSTVSLPRQRLVSAGAFFAVGAIPIVPHVLAPPWRTADFGNGSERVTWTSPLDPGEKKAYTIDCSRELMDISNKIDAVNIILDGLAMLAGLRIDAMSNDRAMVTLWTSVNPMDQTRPNWAGAGETHYLTCRIDVTDGQRFERDVTLQIKQLGL